MADWGKPSFVVIRTRRQHGYSSTKAAKLVKHLPKALTTRFRQFKLSGSFLHRVLVPEESPPRDKATAKMKLKRRLVCGQQGT